MSTLYRFSSKCVWTQAWIYKVWSRGSSAKPDVMVCLAIQQHNQSSLQAEPNIAPVPHRQLTHCLLCCLLYKRPVIHRMLRTVNGILRLTLSLYINYLLLLLLNHNLFASLNQRSTPYLIEGKEQRQVTLLRWEELQCSLLAWTWRNAGEI